MMTFISKSELCAQTVSSKSSGNDIKIVNDLINHKVDIQFKADEEILNLLVLVSDSLGHTIFLDNQYRFKGNYIHSVDLKEVLKGRCFLKISRDGDLINRTLINE